MNEFFPEDYKYSFEQFNYKDLEKKLNLLNEELVFEEAVSEVKINILEKLNEKNIYLSFSRILD